MLEYSGMKTTFQQGCHRRIQVQTRLRQTTDTDVNYDDLCIHGGTMGSKVLVSSSA
ncbi:hypothetical protein GLOTRDRAFT_112310 [Gloeophyllum trabeum ATCC 11539]|uniref:Uncharacterized protein n=1 Tax=Gloeophyllum trabeum (strain ATCC 11539 / FP-39264 / Madison 617) TaxID=670483 RepID=S7RGV3_GLOTA|nr:uncharacterized protein GLOTRDRAFT_112310 [Gloeophyllum trabeum ATCC 11539]EPQ51794.1 hypothetical protein GLOTRDRAFT_112310 [Gloeophyllum trabeum ATCC 11539]